MRHFSQGSNMRNTGCAQTLVIHLASVLPYKTAKRTLYSANLWLKLTASLKEKSHIGICPTVHAWRQEYTKHLRGRKVVPVAGAQSQ